MTHINQRRDSAAAWAFDNPVLMEGEVGWEEDTRRSKLGDGVSHWNDLLYTVSDPSVTAADIGLGNVDNTHDMDKPVSTATSAAITAAVNAKVIDSIVDADTTHAPSRNAVFDALAAKAPLASPAFTGNPTAPTPAAGDNDTSLATTAFVKAALDALLLAMHPVGSIKLTTVNTNPGTYLGGTWAAWGSGRVPVGVDGSAEFPTPEYTNGERTHLLTAAESGLPDHSHSGGATGPYNVPSGTFYGLVTSSNTGTVIGGARNATNAHNNLQPYITCYMWKRTA